MLGELEARIVELERTFAQLVRIGQVTTLLPDAGKVRVTIADEDALLSYELPVLFPKTHHDKFYDMPDAGEHVVCIFLPIGLEQGFVIGAFYSKADAVPVADNDKLHVRFKDGTTIEYDRKRGVLTVDCVNRVVVQAATRVQVQAARIDLN